MYCILCNSKCIKSVYDTRIYFSCENCMENGMSKYLLGFLKGPIRLMTRTIWLNNLYIQIDYINKCTVLSKIDGCFLLDTVQINKLFPLDIKNPFDIVSKIKALLLFS